MLAKIYRPAKNAMQSGKARHEASGGSSSKLARAPTPDALMGWISSADPYGQVRMDLRHQGSRDRLRAHARHPAPGDRASRSQAHLKAYSDNFAFRRREPWSH